MYYFILPPSAFTPGSTFRVQPGSSVRSIARQAHADGFVRSSLLLNLILNSRYKPNDLFAGDYYFAHPSNVFIFAATLAGKQAKTTQTRLTFPEGITIKTMATLAASQLPEFSTEEYIKLADGNEGKLFPETYFVPSTFKASDLVSLQLSTYEEKINPLRPLIASSSLAETEVLTLASIIEREANNIDSMRTVAGIYLNRLALGMPLQADASIEYILDKPLGELVPEDLKIDSPYNTYLYSGLPPTPIGNPGLQAIEAVLDPIESDYFYYLTAPDGTFYYAKTHTEHKQNIERYLK